MIYLFVPHFLLMLVLLADSFITRAHLKPLLSWLGHHGDVAARWCQSWHIEVVLVVWLLDEIWLWYSLDIQWATEGTASVHMCTILKELKLEISLGIASQLKFAQVNYLWGWDQKQLKVFHWTWSGPVSHHKWTSRILAESVTKVHDVMDGEICVDRLQWSRIVD